MWRGAEFCGGLWRVVEGCGGVWRGCGGVWRVVEGCGGLICMNRTSDAAGVHIPGGNAVPAVVGAWTAPNNAML